MHRGSGNGNVGNNQRIMTKFDEFFHECSFVFDFRAARFSGFCTLYCPYFPVLVPLKPPLQIILNAFTRIFFYKKQVMRNSRLNFSKVNYQNLKG